MKRYKNQPTLSPGGAIVLGLLLDGGVPRSGYELQKQAAASVAHFWPVTKAHVYGELPKLEALGYVSGEDIAQTGVPDKRVFTGTTRGATAFGLWLADIDLGEPKLRHPLLLKVFFGGAIAPAALRLALDEHAAHTHAVLERYRALLLRSQGGKTGELNWRRLAVLHGVRRLEADLGWLAEVQAFLNLNETAAFDR